MDKSLTVALLISAIFHLAIILPLPYFNQSLVKKSPYAIKITYLAAEEIALKDVRRKAKPPAAIQHKAPKKEVAAKAKEDLKPKPLDDLTHLAKPTPEHLAIEIPPELPKEKEALYLNYYQSIREKIRKIVLNNYPRYIACGEVCLYFVLTSNGELKEIRVVEERSSQNRLLKEIAERSVYQASPFLAFPKDLNQPQLSFNVIISFELEK